MSIVRKRLEDLEWKIKWGTAEEAYKAVQRLEYCVNDIVHTATGKGPLETFKYERLSALENARWIVLGPKTGCSIGVSGDYCTNSGKLRGRVEITRAVDTVVLPREDGGAVLPERVGEL